MKKLLLLSTIIFFISCGTDQGPGLIFRYTVANKTNYDITAKGYHTNGNLNPVVVKIKSNESITKTFEQSLPAAEIYRFANFFGSDDKGIDSLVIIYGDERFQTFKSDCGNNNENPLDGCFYNGREEKFVFTSANFDEGIDCNSECN